MKGVVIPLLGDDFRDVTCQFREACRLVAVLGIVVQQLAVFAKVHAAPTGSEDESFGAGLDVRPQGVDVLAHEGTRFIRLGHVMALGAARAVAGRNQPDSEAIQYAGGGGIDVGREAGLHASLPDQLAPAMRPVGPAASLAPQWNSRTQVYRQEASQGLPCA